MHDISEANRGIQVLGHQAINNWGYERRERAHQERNGETDKGDEGTSVFTVTNALGGTGSSNTGVQILSSDSRLVRDGVTGFGKGMDSSIPPGMENRSLGTGNHVLGVKRTWGAWMCVCESHYYTGGDRTTEAVWRTRRRSTPG